VVVESGVRSVPIVVMKERRQMSSAHGGVLIRTGISPFAQGSLDKAFGLAIGARSVRAGEEMA